MKRKLASYTSNFFNPFLLGLIVIPLFAFHDTETTADALKWTGISLLLSVVPVLVLIICMVKKRKLDGIFDNPRPQRYLVYGLASVLGAAGVLIMWLGKAPHLLFTTFLTGFIAIIVFMTVNFFWKISLHTAFISASATVLTIVYGPWGALTFLSLPAVAWSRIELNQHTSTQVLAGMMCAATITLAVFWRAGYL